MILLVKAARLAALIAALVVTMTSTAPFADAGLRNALENVRDTVKCTSKAVFRPLKTLEWGIKNFGRLSAEEYNQEADKSAREVMKECLEASESIMARSFGVKKVAGKARDLAASAKSTMEKVKKWFGKGKDAKKDHRIALSVGDSDRRFYEKETGVLGRKPLPVATPSPLHDDVKGDEYWNKELPVKAQGVDPWADLPEREGRNRGDTQGQEDTVDVVSGARCADAWADCSTREDIVARWGSDRERIRQGTGSPNQPKDVGSVADYTTELASLLGERESGSDPDYRTALEKLQERVQHGKQGEEAERARAKPSVSSPTGSTRSSSSASSNCEEDVAPTCSRALSSAERMNRRLSQAIEFGGMSEAAAIQAKMFQNGRNAARTCVRVERRPHCQAMHSRAVEELQRAYKSALSSMSSYTGGSISADDEGMNAVLKSLERGMVEASRQKELQRRYEEWNRCIQQETDRVCSSAKGGVCARSLDPPASCDHLRPDS